MMTQTKKTQNPKKSDKLPWPFPVVNGERTEASKSLLKDGKALLAASKRIQRRRDSCEDMPEATF